MLHTPRNLDKLTHGKGEGPANVAVYLGHERFSRIRLGTVYIDAATEQECINYVLDALDSKRGGVLVTPNVDHLLRCERTAEYRQLVAQADLVVADGMPLVWASRLLGEALPERVTGSNLINSLSAEAGRRSKSVFLLGGDPGTAEAAADVLKRNSPDLRIAGVCCPPFGFENDPGALEQIKQDVVKSGPDIVFVALGSPKQEILSFELRHLVPGAWWIGVGISFSFVCGAVKRAPVWMQRTGLEFAYRLSQEPRRLARRYLVDNFPFCVRLLISSFFRRFKSGLRPTVRRGSPDLAENDDRRSPAHSRRPTVGARSAESGDPRTA